MNAKIKTYNLEEQTFNHMGGVTSRGYTTFTGTEEELEAHIAHKSKFYHNIIVEEAK